MRSRPTRSQWLALVSFTATVWTVILASPSVASAQASTYRVLYAFGFAAGNLDSPKVFIQAADGTFYGAANVSATHDSSVFKMNADGLVTVVGRVPGEPTVLSLLQGTDGNFYGTSMGSPGGGLVFKMTATGTVTSLIGIGTSFDHPEMFVMQAADGNLYGTVYCPQCSLDGVFKGTLNGTFTMLHQFAAGTDGSHSQAALVQAADGTFFGTTSTGGSAGKGTVFKMTSDGAVTVLHPFTGSPTDGDLPRGALIQAADGNLYGTTQQGGTFGLGTVFKMTPTGTLTVPHSFTSDEVGGPGAALIQGSDGSFYGLTAGTIFTMTAEATVTVLHTFTGGPNDGASPSALIQARDGYLYGVTFTGGPWDTGVVFRLGQPPLVTAANVSLSADFDGDGKSDLAVWRPGDGTWYIRYSSSNYSYASAASFPWGLPGDTPLVADLDGDGKADLVVYRPSNGTWYVRFSSSGYSYATWTSYQWGLPGDVPVPADFDGDGKTDLVVYRPSNGTWYIRFSSSGYSYATWTAYQWGLPGDVPTAADLDGDHKADLVVWRPSNGTWYALLSSSNYSYATLRAYQWGLPGDIPVPGDFDGDHKTDLVVWRPSNGTWYVEFTSSIPSSGGFGLWTFYQWGLFGDLPL